MRSNGLGRRSRRSALVSATTAGDDGRVILEPTRAVLHRTVATPNASAAGESDCRPV
jgi:hypothetical protein